MSTSSRWSRFIQSFRRNPSSKSPRRLAGSRAIRGGVDELESRLLLTVSGFKWNDLNGNGVRDTDLIAGAAPAIVFVIDVSGSTGSSFSGDQVGDVNNDGRSNSVLDAELAGFIALNQNLIDRGFGTTARVAIVPFGSRAKSLDMGPQTFGTQDFTSPLADDNGDGVPDVEEILRTIKSGHDGVGGGTRFEPPLQESLSLLIDINAGSDGNVIFLSDGGTGDIASYADEVQALQNAGTKLTAFGVGNGANLTSLQAIDPNASVFTSTNELLSIFNGLAGNNVNFTEPPLQGWTIYLDLNGNGLLDAGEPSDVTEADGTYQIDNVASGTYVVREVMQNGWFQTFPGPPTESHTITHDGNGVTGIHFGNIQGTAGNIHGRVWKDDNLNSIWDVSELPFPGVEVYLDANNNGVRDAVEAHTFTNANGEYFFSNLPVGDYVVRQTLRSGDTQAYPQAYVGTAYFDASNGNQTHLIEIEPQTGIVHRLGPSVTSSRVHGIVMTNDVEYIGINLFSDTVYRVDPQTGLETVIGSAGANITGGMTYVSATDTIYIVGELPGETGNRLLELDRTTGAVTPISNAIPGISNDISSVAYNSVEDVFVVFDNRTDTFYKFDLLGTAQTLATAASPIHSWSMAFNGTGYVMQLLTNPGEMIEVDPATGQWSQAFQASENVRSESLEFVQYGNIAHRVTVTADQTVIGDFGRDGSLPELLISETGNTIVTESGTTDTFEVRLISQPGSNVVVSITANDPTEATPVTQTATLTPQNWNSGVTITIAGVDDTDVDGDVDSVITVSVVDAQSDDAFDGLSETVTVTTIDDDMPPTQTHLSGFVWRDTNRNGVQDNGELPLAGAQLYLDQNDNGKRDPGEVTVPSQDNGTFEFQFVTPGPHVVRQILGNARFQSSPQSYVGATETASDTESMLYYLDPTTQHIRLAGTPTKEPIDSLVMTRNSRIFGHSNKTNSLYEIDRISGGSTLIGSWGPDVVSGIAYDPGTDTLYAAGKPSAGSTTYRLLIVDRRTATTIPVGAGISGIQSIDGLAFDPHRRRVVAFDNTADSFFEFNLTGSGRKLADASAAIDAQTLTYNGQQFVMQLRQPTSQSQFISVDPDQGVWQNSFTAATDIPSEGLSYVPLSDIAHRVVAIDGQTVGGIDFGQFHIPPGFTITQTNDSTFVSESGTSDALNVILDRRPDFPVAINVASADQSELSVDTNQLVFTPDDWNIPQTVNVTGVDELAPDGNRITRALFWVDRTLSDDSFDFLPQQDVDVTVIDDDRPGFTLSKSAAVVSEGGTADQFTIVLNAKPSGNVAIDVDIEDSTEVSVTPQFLTFTVANWSEPQTVNVFGEDDIEVDGNPTSDLTISVRDVASADEYDSVADQIVSVTTLDDDLIGLYVDRTAVTVYEAGQTDSFSVVLTSAPLSNVVVEITSSLPEEIATDAQALTFTPFNWNQPQSVLVAGLGDDVLDGDAIGTITASVNPALSDDAYDSVPSKILGATNRDTNFAALITSGNSVTTSEYETNSKVQVRLSAAPVTPVTFHVASADESENVVSPASITFTSSNWNLNQEVVITGVEDGRIDGDQITEISFTVDAAVSDDAFDSAPAVVVSAENLDNDIAGFTLSKHTATVDESGTTDTFTVVLNARPETKVVLAVGRQTHGEVVESPFLLTFFPDDWDVPQTVTLRGVDDAVDDGDQQTEVDVAVIPAASDDPFDELPLQTVIVTTIDDDTATLLPVVTGPIGRQQSVRPRLTWSAVLNASSYEVWLEKIGGDSNPVVNPTVTTLNYTPPVDLELGRYRTWVRAIRTDSTMTEWATEIFEVHSTVQVHSLPQYGTDRTPTISWNPVPGAVSYRVYANNSTTMHFGVINHTVTGTSMSPSQDLSFGQHRIWVQPIGTDGYPGAWSEGVNYALGPNLLSPTLPTYDSTPLFSWETTPGVTSFQFFLKRGNTIVVNQTGLTGTTFTVPEPLQSGDHEWWVRPLTADGRSGPWSTAGKFNVGGRTTILAPQGTTTSGSPTLSWLPVEGAQSYEIYLQNDSGLELIERRAGVTATSYTPETPLPAGNYRAWARARHSDGTISPWSRDHAFAVTSAAPGVVATPLSPVNPTFNLRPTFTWTASNLAISFEVRVDNGGSNPIVANVSGLSWTPSSDLVPGTSSWSVRGLTATGVPGAWSAPAKFDVSGRPVLLGPTGTVNSSSAQIFWTPVNDANRYILQIDNLTTGTTSFIREENLIAPSFSANSLPSGHYRAWVRSINSSNNSLSPWSLKMDFLIAQDASKEGFAADSPSSLVSVLDRLSKLHDDSAIEPQTDHNAAPIIVPESSDTAVAPELEEADSIVPHVADQFSEFDMDWIDLLMTDATLNNQILHLHM